MTVFGKQVRDAASSVVPTACHVVIVMAIRDGSSCLPQQLESIRAQSHRDWSLIASDDGSSDGSDDIVANFASRIAENAVLRLQGPCRGYAENFLSILRRLPKDQFWIAFSDQDDVWKPDRLERGILALRNLPENVPALYCGRTWITDHDLKPLRLSAARPRPPSFRNALVQNIAAGNTILLNPAASRLVRAAAHETGEVIAHDWWTYQLVTGAGGTVVHDDEPTVLYRQHEANQIGANDDFRARLRRVHMILSGEYRRWNDVNCAALNASAHRLTAEHRSILADFDAIRSASLFRRLNGVARLGLYRQSRLSTAAIWVSAILRRL